MGMISCLVFVVASCTLAFGACGDDARRARITPADDGSVTTPDIAAADTRDGDGDGDGDTAAPSDSRDDAASDTAAPDTSGDTTPDGAPGDTVTPDAVVSCDADDACDDGDPCTDDHCTPTARCVNAPRSCDDHNICTNDACEPGVGCVSIQGVCPPSLDACLTVVCDPVEGCVGRPLDERICDDGNDCTSDTCDVVAGCTFTPISGCTNDVECIGRAPGASCDDGNGATSGDLCLLGSCRGFVLERIPHGVVDDDTQDVVVREVDRVGDTWLAALALKDTLQRERFVLVDLTPAGAIDVVHDETLQNAAFAGLHDGFAGDAGGIVWTRGDDRWSALAVWNDALAASERAPILALFTVRSQNGTRLVWLGGGDERAWLRLCKLQDGGVSCAAQALGQSDGSTIPRALAGVPHCTDGGNCGDAHLAVAADAWLGGGFHITTVQENDDGFGATWSPAFLPDAPANRASRALAAWQDDEGQRFLVVGDGGYMLLRRGDGSWRGPVVVRDAQSTRTFAGVWVGAGVVVVSAHRPAALGQTLFELWVAALDHDLEDGASWTVHELARLTSADGDGLFDVHGDDLGHVRAVGGTRREGELFGWNDGAVWVRTP